MTDTLIRIALDVLAVCAVLGVMLLFIDVLERRAMIPYQYSTGHRDDQESGEGRNSAGRDAVICWEDRQ